MISAPSPIIQFFLDFGILFGLVIAMGSFFRATFDRKLSYSLAGLFIALSFLLFPVSLIFYEYNVNSAVLTLLLVLPFLTGPFLLMFSGIITGFFQESYSLHIISILIIACFAALFYFTGIINFASEYFAITFRIIHALLLLYISIYCFLAIKNILNELSRVKKGSDEIHWLILLLVGYIMGITIVTVPVIITGRYYHPSYMAIIILLIFHFVLMQKYPLLAGFFVEKKKQGIEETTAAIDETELHGLLNDQMDKEKIYLCEDLTLSMLASELDVHSYQLSQFLNNTLGQNFNTLVNSYRVRDARHKLIHDPEKSILKIAFEVGFNSKASFNRVFKEITKMSPSEYRKFFIRLSKEQFYG